jgi:hypothetical protein
LQHKGNDEVDAGKNHVEQEAKENTTREESVESKVDRIVFGALSKVEVHDKQHPLLSIFKKNDDKNFIARHILDGLLTEIYGLLGSTHSTIITPTTETANSIILSMCQSMMLEHSFWIRLGERTICGSNPCWMHWLETTVTRCWVVSWVVP